jgi:hypothetical protein
MMREALARARTSVDQDPIVGVLMHPYDFVESGDSRAVITCDGFNEELKWLVSQPDVRVASVSELAARNQTLDAERFVANAPSRLESVFPPFVRTTDQTPIYGSTATVERTKRRNVTAAVATHVAALAIGAVVGAVSWPLLPLSAVAVATALAALALIILLMRARRSGAIFFRSSMLSAALLGVVIAGLIRAI